MPDRSRLGQHHARRGFGHIGRGGHGDPDLRLPQGGGIVDAIATHADHVAILLQGLDQAVLFGWGDSGEHAERVAVQPLSESLRWGHRVGDANLPGDGDGRGRRVARHHEGRHAHVAEGCDEPWRIRAWRVADRDETRQTW